MTEEIVIYKRVLTSISSARNCCQGSHGDEIAGVGLSVTVEQTGKILACRWEISA